MVNYFIECNFKDDGFKIFYMDEIMYFCNIN